MRKQWTLAAMQRVGRYLVSSLCALSALYCGVGSGQSLPQPPDLVIAKPGYLALVKAMREDEGLLTSISAQIQAEKHHFNAECVANLRPGLVTATIAWAMEPSITAPEVAEATRFFESEAGRKVTSRRLGSAETLPPD